MRLSALDPRWFEHEGLRAGFTILCPCCRSIRLAVALVPLDHTKHWRIFGDENLHHGLDVVPTKDGYAWTANYDATNPFETMTIKPSLDASPSGHWHGFITNGEAN